MIKPNHYICALCGQISFKTFDDYQSHRALYHGLKTQSEPIKPPTVVKRSHREVVAEMESGALKHALISAQPLPPPQLPPKTTEQTPAPHDNDCHCQDCIVSKLQRICDSVILNLDIIEKAITLKQ